MEACCGLDAQGLVLQRGAALGEHGFQVVERGEGLVDQRLIGQWPEALGRLELGRIGW